MFKIYNYIIKILSDFRFSKVIRFINLRLDNKNEIKYDFESYENLEKIEGFDKNLAEEILLRANYYLSVKDEENIKIINEKNIDEELRKIEGLDNKMLALLANKDIITLDDFAGSGVTHTNFDLIDTPSDCEE